MCRMTSREAWAEWCHPGPMAMGMGLFGTHVTHRVGLLTARMIRARRLGGVRSMSSTMAPMRSATELAKTSLAAFARSRM